MFEVTKVFWLPNVQDKPSASILEDALLEAEERIATLEARLREKEAALDQFVLEEVKMCQELAELQETLWFEHRERLSCRCEICTEVERHWGEVQGVV